MVKLCMIMQHSTLCTPCIFAVDHTEQGHEEPPEPAQVLGANYEQDQGKPRCI
jgi:hypothetical protein